MTLDPEPWACYEAIVYLTSPTRYERVEVRRHTHCHEGDVHFEPRDGYEQDGDKYPDETWEEGP